MSALQIILEPPTDRDAASFFLRSNVTDASAKRDINMFVRGIKQLGLWHNTICWPLRSSQNAGSGTTAFSLGGLAESNGTLVNGVAWGPGGANFDGSDDRIDLPIGSLGTGANPTSIWVFLKNTTNATRMIALSHGNNNLGTDAFSLESPTTNLLDDSANIAFTNNLIDTKTTSYKCLFIGNTTDGFHGKNGGAVSQFALNNTLNKSGNFCAIGCFRDPLGAYFHGVVAAVIRINSTPTSELNSKIYSIYKSTLGKGLELP